MADSIHVRDDFDGTADQSIDGRPLTVQEGVAGVEWTATPPPADEFSKGISLTGTGGILFTLGAF